MSEFSYNPPVLYWWSLKGSGAKGVLGDDRQKIRKDMYSNLIKASLSHVGLSRVISEDLGGSYIGIFWYNSVTGLLFGVEKERADSVNLFMTFDDFKYQSKVSEKEFSEMECKFGNYWHADWWLDRQNEIKSGVKGFEEKYGVSPQVVAGMDYHEVPRGRVVQLKSGLFVVCVGKWVNEKSYNKKGKGYIEKLVRDEFGLKVGGYEMVLLSHWDVKE